MRGGTTIDLTGHDDAQLIFETLNDRGTPLLKADLIKNWIFRKGEKLGADVTRWADEIWAGFDGGWWRDEIRQGRLSRSRIDIFLQYWLTMRRQDEVKAENSFRVFTEYAEPLMTTGEAADKLLKDLRRDADTYREFSQLDVATPEGQFYSRVIERLELAVTMPVFLWLLSSNHGIPAEQRKIGLEAFESWAIRRMLLRLPTKDMNKFAIATLKTLDSIVPEETGHRLVDYLSSQTSETRIWPSDAFMANQLLTTRIYGNIRQVRIRVILGAVEQNLRVKSPKYAAVSLPGKLEIEHVMPRGWRSQWDTNPKLSVEAAAERDARVNTIGNLTFVTKSLNGSLSNRPWTDDEAKALSEGGAPGKGKRTLLDQFSLLVLNKEILVNRPNQWTEEDIMKRSTSIIATICDVWPGPKDDMRMAEG